MSYEDIAPQGETVSVTTTRTAPRRRSLRRRSVRLGAVRLGAVAVLVAAAGVTLPGPAQADTPDEVFQYEPSARWQEVVVPAGVTSARVTLRGADGGQVKDRDGTGAFRGGLGAQVSGSMPVKEGMRVFVWVGGHGGDGHGGKSGGAGTGAAGDAGAGGAATSSGGAGGGGATTLLTGSPDSGDLVATAGGGGGAGGFGFAIGEFGGAGGDAGQDAMPGKAGGGPGAGGGGGAGSSGTGKGEPGAGAEDSAGGGGGGGAGFRGGGGGAAGVAIRGSGGGGGGAGSSSAPLLSDVAISTAGTAGQAPANGGAEISWVSGTTATVSLTSATESVVSGGPLAVTAILPPDATGYVRFVDDTIPANGLNGTLNKADVIGGRAELTKSYQVLPVGENTIRAVYYGDAKYAASTSAPFTLMVTAAAAAPPESPSQADALTGLTGVGPRTVVVVALALLVLLAALTVSVVVRRRRAG